MATVMDAVAARVAMATAYHSYPGSIPFRVLIPQSQHNRQRRGKAHFAIAGELLADDVYWLQVSGQEKVFERSGRDWPELPLTVLVDPSLKDPTFTHMAASASERLCPKKGVWNFQALKTPAFIEAGEFQTPFFGQSPSEPNILPEGVARTVPNAGRDTWRRKSSRINGF